MVWDKSNPTRTVKLKVSPLIFTDNWECIEAWSGVEHHGITHALSGRHVLGAAPLVAVGTSASIHALTSCVPCAMAFNTDNVQLMYYSGIRWENLGGTVESGTKMLFYADTAPVGWTIDITHNDLCAFITHGSALGGTAGAAPLTASTWTEPNHSHTSYSHALCCDELPEHSHYLANAGAWVLASSTPTVNGVSPHGTGPVCTLSIIEEGGDQVHTSSYDAAGSVASWRPYSYCCIICSKD